MKNLKDFKDKKFHFIGIGGISMSALAQILKHDGFYVQGSDEVINDEIKKLMKKKIPIFLECKIENLLNADVVVYSSAIHEDNVELKYAREHGLLVLKRAELLGLVSKNYKTVIAVAGSHGKTTTTAMISEIFINANYKPTIHLGGRLKSLNSNYKIGNKHYFITENCEYMDNFLFVNPDISIVLNIDSDHLDYFHDLDGVKESFYKYVSGTNSGGINIVCDQDENSVNLKQFENSITFGLDKFSDIFARNIKEYKPGYYSFDVAFEKCFMGNIKLNIIGKHNILNALASILVALICEIDFDVIKQSIEHFSGVKRRCEYIGEINGASVFHDYAHHPRQIEKMISVANSIKNGGRTIVAFEPHTFSRTKFLLEDFAKSFKEADLIFFLPVYSAREKESDGLNSNDLASETKKYVTNVENCFDYNDIKTRLKMTAKKGDVVMILGAGSIEKLSKLLFVK